VYAKLSFNWRMYQLRERVASMYTSQVAATEATPAIVKSANRRAAPLLPVSMWQRSSSDSHARAVANAMGSLLKGESASSAPPRTCCVRSHFVRVSNTPTPSMKKSSASVSASLMTSLCRKSS
jgi:hypothetical protein